MKPIEAAQQNNTAPSAVTPPPPNAPPATMSEVTAQRGALVRLAYRLCWRMEDAEDAVQNALLQATRRTDQLHDGGKLWSWIRSIVVRQCSDLHRARRRRQSLAAAATDRQEHQPPPTAPAEESSRAEMAGWVRQAVQALPEGQRTALTLRHLENLGYREIGELMGISESTARVQVRNAREALRQSLLQQRPEWTALE